MKKGLSPVVAVVLLIAIAVVAAAGVWFWVAPMLSGTTTGGAVAEYHVTLTGCKMLTNDAFTMNVRNIGTKATLSGQTGVPVYNANTDVQVGTMDLASISAGALEWKNLTNTTTIAGTYYFESADFAKTKFSC